jgi:hypothetical protein
MLGDLVVEFGHVNVLVLFFLDLFFSRTVIIWIEAMGSKQSRKTPQNYW